MSKKHVKLMGLILAVLMIVALFAGCGNPSTTQAPEGTPSVEPDPSATGTPGQELHYPENIDVNDLQGKKITIYTDGEIPSDPTARDYRMREDFTKKYGVTFEHVATGGEEDGWMTKLALLVATNAGPTIVDTDNSAMPLAAARGLVQPIDQWVNEQDTIFLKEPMDAYSWKGNRYVMQYRSWITFRSIIYSLTAFERAGIEAPLETWQNGEWTWDKLFEVSKEFFETDAAGAQTSYGWTFTNVDVGFALGLNDAEFFTSGDSGYKLNASDPKVQEILTMLHDANQRGDIMYRSTKQAEVAKGTVKMYGQIWERAERLLDLPEAQESGNLMQSVPMPTGPSASQDEMYGLVPWFSMIGANSPNPDAGYFWTWYNGDQFEPEPREGDPPAQTEEEYIASKPEHVQGMYAIFNDIKENGHFVIATNVEGIPGFSDLFTSLCNQVYRDKGSLSTVLTELTPQMEEALSTVEEYVPSTDEIGTPKLPEAGVDVFEAASDAATVTVADGKMTIELANPENDWVEIDAAKIAGDYFFPALVYYNVSFDYKITEGFEALEGGCISFGLKSPDGEVLSATTLWGDYEEEGTLTSDGKTFIVDQNKQDGAYFFIDFSLDSAPATIEITNFSITVAE